jgi:hypothetical protein
MTMDAWSYRAEIWNDELKSGWHEEISNISGMWNVKEVIERVGKERTQ